MPVAFPNNPSEFCITDVGSTTTKAFLFQKRDTWRIFHREAATTVEKPDEDVTIGVTEALRALAEESGSQLIKDGVPAVPYLSTSSAGGGLAMVVTGLMRTVTSYSAERVALGAGAIVLDVIAMDDGRTPYEKVQALMRLRPDMVLLAGGFDGDALSGPVFLAELICEAGLRPKLSREAHLPVVYAGNKHARRLVADTLGDRFMFHPVANIRPSSEIEDLDAARTAIHDLFMDHVMSQAPGYERLVSWVSAPILPTPAAFARILEIASRELRRKILAIDIGGATTDVFTAENGTVFRTVSANLGMSYSVLNVARTAGIPAISELLQNGMSDRELWDRIGDKYLQPTCLPTDETGVRVEWATATVAIREAVRDHQRVRAGISLSRGKEELTIRGLLDRGGGKRHETGGAFKLDEYDLVIGSGGILSHSPREAAVMMMIDALRPRDSVTLAVDSAFVFPHLGVLASLNPDLALQLFQELGLVRLGTVAEVKTASASIDARSAVPPARERRVAGGERIERGVIRLRRELAVAGDLFVRNGASVKADTLIARSTRLFRRPFFLEIARVLGIPPEEVPACVLKKTGDTVEREDLVARRKVSLIKTKEYRSPVAGVVERLLPSGTLVIREKPESAAARAVIQVAQDLAVHPDQIRPYVKVEIGQSVERGQVVASLLRPGTVRRSCSPLRGKVKEINYDYGLINIEPLREELEVRAWMPGTVEAVTDRGCTVSGRGVRMEGVWGLGGEISGRLALGAPESGSVLVTDFADRETLETVADRGGRGLVTGGLHLADVLEIDPGYTIVVTEGFDRRAMDPGLKQELERHVGRVVLLDGTTELRVGVRRPIIILPEEG